MKLFAPGRNPKKLIGFIISIIAIGFLVIRAYQGISGLAFSSFSFSFEFFFVSILFQLAGVCFAAAVWSGILKHMGIETGYIFDLQAFGLSALGRKIPGVVWFAVGRMFIYEKKGVSKTTILAATIMELIINSIAGIFIVIFTTATGDFKLPFTTNIIEVSGIALLLIVILLIISPFIVRNTFNILAKRIGSLQTAAVANWDNWDIIRWIFTMGIVLIFGAGVIYSVGAAIAEFPNLSFPTVLDAWGLLVALDPLAMWLPGEIGVKDGLMYIFLSPIMGGPPAALLVLAWRAWISILEITFGVISGISLGMIHKRNARIPSHD